jgi:hypothetical protein
MMAERGRSLLEDISVFLDRPIKVKINKIL